MLEWGLAVLCDIPNNGCLYASAQLGHAEGTQWSVQCLLAAHNMLKCAGNSLQDGTAGSVKVQKHPGVFGER